MTPWLWLGLGAAVLIAIGLVSGYWAFPIGIIVAYGLGGPAWLRHLRRHENGFMWRHGTSATETVWSDLSEVQARERLDAELERQGRWRVQERADGLDAIRGMTMNSWITRLRVEWRPSGDRLWVSITCRSPQLTDWGAGRRVVRGLTTLLEQPASSPM